MAVTGDVQFINGINMTGGGSILLNQLIQDMINQTTLDQDLSDLRDKALLFQTRAIGENDVFTALSGPVELDPILENGLKTEQTRSKTPNKGYKIKEYGGKLTTSYLMRKWLEKTTDLNGADSSVLQGWADFLNNGKFLFDGGIYNMGIDVINLFYKGFSITAQFGPGSATPKGQPMFSATQPVRNGALTFSNILTTPNQALAYASLQDSLDIHKKQLRFDNGYRARLPKGPFELWVSRANAINARKILNTPGSMSDIYSGAYGASSNSSNGAQRNQFAFDGNDIMIKEFELQGDTDKNNVLIGSDAAWYVANPDNMKVIKGLRLINLYDPEVKTYVNNETDGYICDIRL